MDESVDQLASVLDTNEFTNFWWTLQYMVRCGALYAVNRRLTRSKYLYHGYIKQLSVWILDTTKLLTNCLLSALRTMSLGIPLN